MVTLSFSPSMIFLGVRSRWTIPFSLCRYLKACTIYKEIGWSELLNLPFQRKFKKYKYVKLAHILSYSGPEVINLFSCSTQLSTKFHLLIKSKILTNEKVSCLRSLRCCIYHAHK